MEFLYSSSQNVKLGRTLYLKASKVLKSFREAGLQDSALCYLNEKLIQLDVYLCSLEIRKFLTCRCLDVDLGQVLVLKAEKALKRLPEADLRDLSRDLIKNQISLEAYFYLLQCQSETKIEADKCTADIKEKLLNNPTLNECLALGDKATAAYKRLSLETFGLIPYNGLIPLNNDTLSLLDEQIRLLNSYLRSMRK